VIRQAVPGDADAVRTLVRLAYEPWIAVVGREPAPMQDDYAAQIAAGQTWVFDDHGPLAVLVVEDAPDHLLIENVAVAPSAQGRGLGRRLLAQAAALARERNRPTLRLYTNALMHTNIALYAHLGFHQTHRNTVSGFERVYMALDVDGPFTL